MRAYDMNNILAKAYGGDPMQVQLKKLYPDLKSGDVIRAGIVTLNPLAARSTTLDNFGRLVTDLIQLDVFVVEAIDDLSTMNTILRVIGPRSCRFLPLYNMGGALRAQEVTVVCNYMPNTLEVTYSMNPIEDTKTETPQFIKNEFVKVEQMPIQNPDGLLLRRKR